MFARIKIKLWLNLTNVDENGRATIKDAPTQSGLIFPFAMCSNLNDTMTITINIYSVKKVHVTHKRRARERLAIR